MDEHNGAWVYAVAAAIRPARLAGVTGVSGPPVHVVTSGGLAAAVSAVSLAEFGEQPLRQHLEDLGWLERTARAHHRVIEAVAAGGPVVPMRLATIYAGDGNVAAMLAGRSQDFAAALGRVTGRAEWGVKAYAPPVSEPSRPGASSGAEYLKRRRAQLSAREQAQRAAAATAQDLHATLSELAAAAVLRPAQQAELAGQDAAMILNGTYLVDDGRSAEFAALARERAGHSPGIRVEVTGPWPPYSFATIDWPGGLPMSEVARRDAGPGPPPADRVALVDLLDRVLAGGVVVTGEVRLSIADVDLVQLSLNVLISSVRAGLAGPAEPAHHG